MTWTATGTIRPAELGPARDQSHRAAQWVTKAARANLAARSDDSQSNLGWDQRHGALVSHALRREGGARVEVGVQLGDLRLLMLEGGAEVGALDLSGRREREIGGWLDDRLTSVGLSPASPVELPYALPESAAKLETYDVGVHGPALAELARWFESAHALLAEAAATVGSQASPVRCWPHHFDIASLVSLEEGDAETARSIGMGMSPGDESFAEPYFYVNPWPGLSADGLPALPEPGRWHVEGWVGAVARGTDILTLTSPEQQMRVYLKEALAIGRRQLGL